jgi:hypothetical protein
MMPPLKWSSAAAPFFSALLWRLPGFSALLRRLLLLPPLITVELLPPGTGELLFRRLSSLSALLRRGFLSALLRRFPGGEPGAKAFSAV